MARDECMCGARVTRAIGANRAELDPPRARSVGGAPAAIASMTLATTRAVSAVRAGLRMRRLFDSHSGADPVTRGRGLANPARRDPVTSLNSPRMTTSGARVPDKPNLEGIGDRWAQAWE